MQTRDTPALGFLKLDTKFPRILGDGGCAETWPFPVIYHTVDGALPVRVVHEQAHELLPAFIEGGRQLAAQGAAGIATTCGFLCLHQRTLEEALPVPVLTSALLSGGKIQRALPPAQKIGILTVSPADLSDAHLHAAGIDPQRTVIGGLPPDSGFADTLLNNRENLDVEGARRDMCAAARSLCECDSSIGALLLECANMPPYSDDIAAATGLPVHSLKDAVTDFHHALTVGRH